MVEALRDLLVVFPGESRRTRCFDHIVNLIAKSIIMQFDVNKGSESLDDALRELIEDLDHEEFETRGADNSEGDHAADDDNTEGWVDEREEMSEIEQEELDRDVQPVRRVLVKVSLALLVVFSVLMLTAALAPQDGVRD